jgi:protease IV
MPSLRHRHGPLLLELDLNRPLVETEPEDPVGKLRSRGRPRLKAVLRALHEAGDDPQVVGLIARVGDVTMPLAIAQELRTAVAVFAASGKPTVAWAETFGEAANGMVPYVLATGFREIWLQPSGDVGLIGVAAEATFLRGALDKAGVEPQLEQRYEYKNAADRVMRTHFTDAHRESADRLAASTWETVAQAVATARKLAPEALQDMVDTGPLSAAEALEAGLVDSLGYRDEVYAEMRRRVGDEAQLRFADRWSPRRSAPQRVKTAVTRRHAPVVALVEGHGAIVTGRSRRMPFQGQVMGSDTIAAALRAARDDDRVGAVVFRVDSPGGSYVASDTVWREVGLTSAAGKPVVVSMGTLAGSGGYFVACAADVIVAQPSTLTGSIGVFGGKAVVSGLTERFGLTTDAVSRGRHARMFSTRVGFTDDERTRLDRWLDAVYADFVGKVAAGRGMDRDAVHDIARGRVWTGADAAGIGLVDILGGLHDAVRIARERAGLASDAAVRPAVHVPLLARLTPPTSSRDPRAAAATHLGGWGDRAAVASSLGLPAAGPLSMPTVSLR